MKLFKISFLAGLAAVMVMGLTGSAFAFHDGGVAVCEGCHSMHNSLGGENNTVAGSDQSGASTLNGPADTATQSNTEFLLKGSDQSSTCLNCHGSNANGSYHVLTTQLTKGTGLPLNYTPGGDFGWLQAIAGSANTANTEIISNGHHIIAKDFGLTVSSMATAPGGNYPSGSLACSSCHDPHGRYRQDTTTGAISGPSTPGAAIGAIVASGSYPYATSDGTTVGVYRLLGGVGYEPKSMNGSGVTPFGAASPIAVAPKTYNFTDGEATAEVRVAYGSGMSEWCANCHPGMLNSGKTSGATDKHRHPAGAGATMDGLGGDVAGSGGGTSTIADNYNSYVKSGDMSGTKQYTSLIPIELNNGASRNSIGAFASNNKAVGAQDTNLVASASTSVMCLSCHRAHATGFDSMTRFDVQNEFIDQRDWQLLL